MQITTKRVGIIIHLFAIAHAIMAVGLRWLNMDDSIVLTMLTIALIIILSRIYTLPVDVTIALTLLCCFAGFYLGTFGATVLQQILNSDSDQTFINAITTLTITEILGWMTYLIASNRRYDEKES